MRNDPAQPATPQPPSGSRDGDTFISREQNVPVMMSGGQGGVVHQVVMQKTDWSFWAKMAIGPLTSVAILLVGMYVTVSVMRTEMQLRFESQNDRMDRLQKSIDSGTQNRFTRTDQDSYARETELKLSVIRTDLAEVKATQIQELARFTKIEDRASDLAVEVRSLKRDTEELRKDMDGK